MRDLKKIYIRNKVRQNIINGHPWCFSGAIEKTEENITDGEICKIFSETTFLGIGYYNSRSEICIRILTRKDQDIDEDFFKNHFLILNREKRKFLNNTNTFRLVNGEGDNIPGLIVDIYDRAIIIQIHTLGMEKLKKIIVKALVEIFSPLMIYERRDMSVRIREGMDRGSGLLLHGELVNYVKIIENDFKFLINVVDGQKTGFFLDQRENRKSILRYCIDKNVLNCFSYTGGFSVYAAVVGKSVTSVDISKNAIEEAKRNFLLNNFPLENYGFITGDVFEYLKDLKKNEYDVIILDPPSFAKSRNQIKNAIKAYITINSKALEKLADYGILVSSSCTSHISEMDFIKILHQSSANANCQLRVLEASIQPQDHSYNLSFPEGRYLKFFILQKIPVN